MNRFRLLVAAAVVAASLFSLTSCSVLSGGVSTPQKSTAEKPQTLPLTWRDYTAAWVENDPVRNVISLPSNVAYVAKRSFGDEFMMYSPDGKVVLRLGTPDELPDATSMIVKSAFVDGKTYITVIQMSGPHYVATGFDEGGKQLFRKVELNRSSSDVPSVPDLHPVAGWDNASIGYSIDSKGIQSKRAAIIDGISITNSYDPATGKHFLSAPGWEREQFMDGPVKSYVNPAGRYLCLSEMNGSSITSAFVDVHTGKDVPVGDGVLTCLNSSDGPVDSQIVAYRSLDIVHDLANTYGKNIPEGGASWLAVPSMGKSWAFNKGNSFIPYSYDPVGRVYGYLMTDGKLESGAFDTDGKSQLIRLIGSPRVPVAITLSGIGVFPTTDVRNLYVKEGESYVGDTMFAVKKVQM